MSDDIYFYKYLNYKTKYLELKHNTIGGATITIDRIHWEWKETVGFDRVMALSAKQIDLTYNGIEIVAIPRSRASRGRSINATSFFADYCDKTPQINHEEYKNAYNHVLISIRENGIDAQISLNRKNCRTVSVPTASFVETNPTNNFVIIEKGSASEGAIDRRNTMCKNRTKRRAIKGLPADCEI
jgi:hypothetical protein